MFSHVKADLQRFFVLETQTHTPGLMQKCHVFIAEPALHAVLLYRYQHWVIEKAPGIIFRKLGLLLVKPISFWFNSVRGVIIDAKAQIGKGLYIGHPVGIVIGQVEIGENCNIGHYVTIGVGGKGADRGIPRFGNQVWIGSMSVISGKIEIGDKTTIMPGTVLSKSVPPGSTVGGNPGRILLRDTDNQDIIFGSGFNTQKLT